MKSYQARYSEIRWSRSFRLDIQNITTVWLSEHARGRKDHRSFVLPWWGHLKLVLVDVPQWVRHLLVWFPASSWSRFASLFYEHPKGALFKLSQCGTVNDYLTEFERLINRVIGLPPPFLLSCFIFGLALEIRREVLAIQPISLPQATALAKLQKYKLRDWRSSSHRPNNFSSPSSHPTNLNQKPKPPFVQRTPKEIAFCREKGLCYNCDEKWSSNQHCKVEYSCSLWTTLHQKPTIQARNSQ